MKNLQDYLTHLDKLNIVSGEDFSRTFQVETQSGDIADITYRVDTHEEAHHDLTFQAVLLVHIGEKNVFRWGAENCDENTIIVQWVAKKMRIVLDVNRTEENRVKREFANFIKEA